MKKRGVQSIGAFLASQEGRKSWLEAEKAELESIGSYFSHWGSGQHLGLVITGPIACGEFHAQADGTVTFYVEQGLGETIKSTRVRIGDERGFKEQYAVFRSTVLNTIASDAR